MYQSTITYLYVSNERMNQEKILCFLLEDVVLVGENCLSLFYSERNVYLILCLWLMEGKKGKVFFPFLNLRSLCLVPCVFSFTYLLAKEMLSIVTRHSVITLACLPSR